MNAFLIKNRFWNSGVALLYQSTQAGITKCCRLGGISCRHLFSTPLEAGKSKSKLPVDGRPGEGSHSGLQSAALPPCGLPWVTESPGC